MAPDERQKPPGKPGSPFSGLEAAAEMLNHLDAESRERLLKDIEKRDPETGAKLRKRLLSLGDLLKLDDSRMRDFLRGIPVSLLALALRTAPDAVKDAVFRNLTQRSANTLQEEIDAMGPRLSADIEAAQNEIARRLVAFGKHLS